MLALYRSGRQADALDVYRAGRDGARREARHRAEPAAAAAPRVDPAAGGAAAGRGHDARAGSTSRRSPTLLLAGRVTVVVGADARAAGGRARAPVRPRRGAPRAGPRLAGDRHAQRLRSALRHAARARRGRRRRPGRCTVSSPRCPRSSARAAPRTAAVRHHRLRARARAGARGRRRGVRHRLLHRDAAAIAAASATSLPTGVVTPIERPNAYAIELSLERRDGRPPSAGTGRRVAGARVGELRRHRGRLHPLRRRRRAAAGRARRAAAAHASAARSATRFPTGRCASCSSASGARSRSRYRSWSVHAGPPPLEREFWRRRNVEVIDMAPAAYMAELAASSREAVGMSATAREPVQGACRVRRLAELDALLFFGREREREAIVANLLASRLTVLYGPSGVGKSSLLRAGVAQRLRALGDAVGDRARRLGGGSGRRIVASVHEADPELGPTAGLVDTVAAAAQRNGRGRTSCSTSSRSTSSTTAPTARSADALPELLRRPGLRVNVLIALRDDALAELDAFAGARCRSCSPTCCGSTGSTGAPARAGDRRPARAVRRARRRQLQRRAGARSTQCSTRSPPGASTSAARPRHRSSRTASRRRSSSSCSSGCGTRRAQRGRTSCGSRRSDGSAAPSRSCATTSTARSIGCRRRAGRGGATACASSSRRPARRRRTRPPISRTMPRSTSGTCVRCSALARRRADRARRRRRRRAGRHATRSSTTSSPSRCSPGGPATSSSASVSPRAGSAGGCSRSSLRRSSRSSSSARSPCSRSSSAAPPGRRRAARTRASSRRTRSREHPVESRRRASRSLCERRSSSRSAQTENVLRSSLLAMREQHVLRVGGYVVAASFAPARRPLARREQQRLARRLRRERPESHGAAAPEPLTHAVWSPDGALVATGDADGNGHRLARRATAGRLATIQTTAPIAVLAFTRNALLDRQRRPHPHRADEPAAPSALIRVAGAVVAAALSPDGRRLGGRDQAAAGRITTRHARRPQRPRTRDAAGAGHRLARLQRGRAAARHRQHRQDGAALERRDRAAAARSPPARTRARGELLARRQVSRHVERGRDGGGLGRRHRRPAALARRRDRASPRTRRSARTARRSPSRSATGSRGSTARRTAGCSHRSPATPTP